jgi:2-(1,2-epoxy-1,2-dihydrophenyl)acetyl-CoA isomerase
VVLTGAGKMFCGGGDLKTFNSLGDDAANYVDQTATVLHHAISRFARMAAPVVMAVNGTAAGGGFSLALAGDYVIAADSAKFISAYTASGLTPDGSSTYYLAKHIGLLRAKEMILTNRLLSAEEACDWGLVSKVVPDDQLMDEAMTLARAFAAGPTKAFGIAKNLLTTAYSESLEAQLDAESRGIATTMGSRDGRHGLESFLNKKKPEFTGE